MTLSTSHQGRDTVFKILFQACATLFIMAFTLQSTRSLNDGRTIPALGFGVYQVEPGDKAVQAILWALEAGYRNIDTAACYANEESVGEAIRKRLVSSHFRASENYVMSSSLQSPPSPPPLAQYMNYGIFHSGIPREEIWVTTKLWDDSHGYTNAISAFEFSLEKLGLDYVDLYLIHSPYPGKKLRTESWKGLEELHRKGLVKSIGVSNYGIHHLKELLSICTIKPVVNQIEVTPYLTREDLVAFCNGQNIRVEAYSPLTMGQKLKDPTLVSIARKHGKQPAQILIRWSLQRGFIPLPKSVHKERIIANADVFGWEISAEDMDALTGLNEDFVTEWDPTTCS
ncbi:aldo-keto reductase [Jimgerdemannia flammicorona]|uniref:Aldo-keto reductase n=1 Tax=Jimgerdemannia flammicorona TaxID=994334 RepID=A0A433QLW9_9FUNG|nr:aldo-keto reductase [Jimgerdemannia flammicorona]